MFTTVTNDRKSDYFYRLRLRIGNTGCHNYVYYRSKMPYALVNVPKYAVRDGDLIDAFMHRVDEVKEITPEEYFKYMWE